MVIDVFNEEELVLINGICKNEKLEDLTKEDAMQKLLFSKQVVDDGDAMISDLIDGTVSKLQAMTDSQWDELKMRVPLPTALSAEDEIPEDEAIA